MERQAEASENKFRIVGIRQQAQEPPAPRRKWYQDRPVAAMAALALLAAGCLACGWIAPGDPARMDLANCSVPPGGAFWFGTDTMGRDIFAMIWHGGRISLSIGVAATAISTVLAVLVGAASGCAPAWADGLLMRLTEILLSIPGLPVVILIQAALGKANAMSISLALGVTGWMSMAKVVRSEVRQAGNREYVIAARCMGGGFFHVLRRHLAPNFLPSILFMAVMNVRNAIVAESTLSFLGMGLPVETVTWGSMLSQSENALLTNAWWIILIPGLFLAVTLLCVTSIGNYLRGQGERGQSNL